MSAPASGRILTLNRGSATLKAALYHVNPEIKPALSIKIDRIDFAGTQITIKDSAGKRCWNLLRPRATRKKHCSSYSTGSESHNSLADLLAAGHRLVHGGVQFQEPVRITAQVLAELEKLTPLDPDHLPAALAVIRFMAKNFA